MKKNIFPAIRLTIVCIVFFCGFYTMIVYGISRALPNKGYGELVSQNGKTYYANVGQKFSNDKYFWSRPSAVDYNGSGSAGSNKGPSNPEYLAQVQQRIDTFLKHNPSVVKSEIPSDLVTASGSGLDPDISVEAALVQVKRIAAIRNVSESNLQQLIKKQTEQPMLQAFGTAKINVLKLNLALDQFSNK